MPADLTGIENVHEFFSQHYLDELLVEDLKEQRKQWKAQPGKSPPDALRGQAKPLLRAMNEAAARTGADELYALAHPVQVALAEALGYAYTPGAGLVLDDGRVLPALHRVDRRGDPYLLVVEGRFTQESEAALDAPLVAGQLASSLADQGLALPDEPLRKLVAEAFALERHPRWILLLCGTDAFLAERARWGRGRYLRFDLSELLGRRDAAALAITAALLGHDALAPEGDAPPLHDTLDENSHKHAYGVSTDLKYAAREAVELLGNEWVHYQRTRGKRALYGEHVARELTEECLIYLYRLLFLFYAEARAAELRSLPMNSEEYRYGYSLEALRDLEMIPLTQPDTQDGYFLDESLRTLFSLVHEGYPREAQGELHYGERDERFDERGFRVEGVHSPLFDPKLTPRLSGAKLRNCVLQRVLALLSLSREGRRGRGRRTWGRGRISYAQLGINQLGAVYEGLLSYTGFFAKDTLYEVHEAKKMVDETDQAFFVPESELPRYTEEELAFEADDGETERRRYDPGTFIFRLAGRDRETSASYYTPEVLTRCLVKYALIELLDGGMEPDPERPPLTADEVLGLTVCEPAMGSGAFLVEAIDQLAKAYLDRKQEETGERIEPERYVTEKQKVAAHIAAHNCYGVDLNPMAARLAGVSLWLATMHEGQDPPWYGPRLAVGNSLVGARLAVWRSSDLLTDAGLRKELLKVLKSHGGKPSLEDEVERVLAAAKDSPGAVKTVRDVFKEAKRQWAIEDDEAEPLEGDAAADRDDARHADLAKALKKAITDFRLPRYHRRPPDEVEANAVVADERPPDTIYHFLLPDLGFSPFDKDKAVKELAPDEVETLKAWRKELKAKFTREDARRLVRLSDRIDELYRRYVQDRREVLTRCRSATPVWQQPEVSPGLPIEERARALSAMQAEGMPYARLKSVMDLWAAQWAWPIRDADRLPSRDDWWSEVERLLGVEEDALPTLEEQLELVPTTLPPPADDEPEAEGPRDLNGVVREVCGRLRPLHWELEFAEVFVDGGGFDLVVGNPPWIKLQWNEQGVLSDLDPRLALDGVSASETAKQRARILGGGERVSEYLRDFEALEGAKAVLNSQAEYPLLQGVQTNLYKCFITRGWLLGSGRGLEALIHQEGLFDDPKGGEFRAAIYPRLRWRFQFQNQRKLFADVQNEKRYAILVSACASATRPAGRLLCNLFWPSTIDACIAHDGAGPVRGIKSEEGAFEVRGHRSRLILIRDDELALFASLFDNPGTSAIEARLPIVHSREVLDVLRKLAQHPKRLRDLGDSVVGTVMWDETGAQRDGTIRRETRYPNSPSGLIVQGPHFYVGTPFSKTPRQGCSHNKDYEIIDLEQIPNAYLPRTNYTPQVAVDTYRTRMPRFRGRPVDEFYRHVHRRMLPLTGERSLACALVPPAVGHVHTVVGIATDDHFHLVSMNAFFASLPCDFFVRAKGGSDLTVGATGVLPLPRGGATASSLAARGARQAAITTHYADLWNDLWPRVGDSPGWTLADQRLSCWPSPDTEWHRTCALRNHFERRWALVEIDALAALELGLTIDELQTIYRTQFPVLRDYEQNTWYDQNGRIVFTTNRGLPGVGHDRKTFEAWQAALEAGDPPPDDADTARYTPPFETRDREADMQHAYERFQELLGE